VTAVPDEWLSMTEPGLLRAPAFSPFFFLFKSAPCSASLDSSAKPAQIAQKTRSKPVLSPNRDRFLRMRRYSGRKHLIYLAQTLPQFALFGPLNSL